MKPAVKNILIIVLTCVLAAYLVMVCVWSNSCAKHELCGGLSGGKIIVEDSEGIGFVTSDSLTAELSPMFNQLMSMTMEQVNLGELQSYISSLDRIESAEVTRLSNNKIRVKVVPMVPVARVWPLSGRSYYINREGKRISASRRYKVDVPQLYGGIPAGASPGMLLPLLDYLHSDPDMNKMITMISAADSSNIILVPAIRGHVVNLGNTSNISDKFRRLRKFYAEVMPTKGWEYYDTISLKWDNQVVATRRHGKLPKLDIEIIEELETEGDDIETVLTTQ